MFHRKLCVKCSLFFQLLLKQWSNFRVVGCPSVVMVLKGCFQKLSQQRRGCFSITRTRQFMHASSMSRGEHSGVKAPLRPHLNIVQDSHSFENLQEIYKKKIYTWHTCRITSPTEPCEKPTTHPDFLEKEQKIARCLGPGSNLQPCASRSHARAESATDYGEGKGIKGQ
jgi:hypothetical protein